MALVAAALLAFALVSGATCEQLMRRGARHTYAVPGRLVDVGGGRHIQIDCRGTGSPTVVLESGLDHLGSLSWAAVHDSIASTTRVCAYSRAGIMWSDPSDEPLTVNSVASDLHAALLEAGEAAPWVLAGHSMGGPYVTAFANRYPSEMRGVVFVDASHPDQFPAFERATGKSLQPTTGLVRIGATLAWSGLVRVVPTGVPPVNWPVSVTAAASAFLPMSVRALFTATAAVPEVLTAVRTSHDLGNVPLVVLTATKEDAAQLQAMGLDAAQAARLRAVKDSLQNDLAGWSRQARHEVVPNASHYIQFDRPDVVIRAIRGLVQAAR